jgi:hypothetical protein
MQKRRVASVQKSIAAELPMLVRRNQMAHDAIKEKTLSGVLRSRIKRSRILFPVLAARADVDVAILTNFLIGVKPLPSDAIDRLVKVLKLRLPLQPSKPARTAKAS